MLRRSALLKTAPFVLGAAAAAVWLQRRRLRPHLALPERAGIEPPPVPPPAPEEVPAAASPLAAESMSADRLAAESLGLAPAPPPPPARRRPRPHRNGRFVRRPIDIVTVVEDLLGAAR
jgi:hypothetical protein